MPAVNVARTDTFEQQRVKINEIGQQIFTVTAGGSDLSTGNLKLPVERSEPPAVTVNIWVLISFILTLCCSKVSVRATLTAGILD